MPTPVLSEYVTLRTLNCGTRAHLARDMSPWWTAAERRGPGVRTVPGQDGGAPRPVRLGPIRFLFEVWVDGRFDVDGVATSDPRQGWRTNLELLEAACAPAAAAPWTFEAVHTLPDGGTRTGQVQVLDIVSPVRRVGVAGVVAVDIQIPSGELTYTAPA